MYLTAAFSKWLSSIWRICPIHWCRRARIHTTKSKVDVALLASSCLVLPVMCESIDALDPFNTLWTSMVRRQASLPYVSIEQYAETYRRSFSDKFMPSADQICVDFLRACGPCRSVFARLAFRCHQPEIGNRVHYFRKRAYSYFSWTVHSLWYSIGLILTTSSFF